MGIWYATREDFKSALDVAETARNNRQVDLSLESASRTLEGFLHRKFYPWTGTRYFDWPNRQTAFSWRLWLGEDELISIDALVSGGDTLTTAQYVLSPANSSPPYTSVEVNLGSDGAFSVGDTPQRSLAITGVFGYDLNELPLSVTAEALDDSETGVDVTNSAHIGVGSLIRVDSERMIVTARGWLTSAQTVLADMAASVAVQAVSVTNGAAFYPDEVILVDTEKMLITDIAGNTLLVKRAYDGSTLAAHTTTTTIYVGRSMTVTRGALGTTAAAHNTAATVYVKEYPGLIRELCLAEAISTFMQKQAGYARVAGSGDNAYEASGKGLKQIRDDAYTAYGRKNRLSAV